MKIKKKMQPPGDHHRSRRSVLELKLFWKVFTSHFIICSFMGLILMELLTPTWNLILDVKEVIKLINIVPLAIMDGLLVGFLTYTIHGALEHRRKKGSQILFGIETSRSIRLKASLVGFICGLLNILCLVTDLGFVVFALLTILMILLQLRRFSRLVIRILQPQIYPTWFEVGDILTIYISILAAFSLFNYSMVILVLATHSSPTPEILPFIVSSGHVEGNFIEFFYFTAVVMTTLGFGDIVPNTLYAKLIIAFECLISYVMFALMIGMVTRGIRHPDKQIE